jgi:hypothetical protein
VSEERCRGGGNSQGNFKEGLHGRDINLNGAKTLINEVQGCNL